jgi:hypothetical protein
VFTTPTMHASFESSSTHIDPLKENYTHVKCKYRVHEGRKSVRAEPSILILLGMDSRDA